MGGGEGGSVEEGLWPLDVGFCFRFAIEASLNTVHTDTCWTLLTLDQEQIRQVILRCAGIAIQLTTQATMMFVSFCNEAFHFGIASFAIVVCIHIDQDGD